MITKPGLYHDMAEREYRADPCPAPSFTQSIAKVLIDRSPAHAKLEHPRLTPPETVDDVESYDAAMAIGNAAHKLMIGRGKEIAIGNFDSWRGGEARKFRDAAFAAGHAPILPHHMARAYAMVGEARKQLKAAGCEEAFAWGDGEVIAIWQEDGLWFRTMIDWVSDRSLNFYDYKTSAMSVAPHVIPRRMVDAGWDIQAAMYERAVNALDPASAGRRRYRFVAQENEPPYALTVVELTEGALTMGRKKLQHAVDIWRACMATGQWPAYPTEILRPEYPGWHESQWLGREVEHEARRTREPMITEFV